MTAHRAVASRTFTSMLALVLAGALLVTAPAAGASAEDVLVNGDFSEGLTGWDTSCNGWGAYGSTPIPCPGTHVVDERGLTFGWASAPYINARQRVVAGVDHVLTGTVDLHGALGSGAVIISVSLLGEAGTAIGGINLYDYPTYTYASTSTYRYVKTTWAPAAPAQPFSLDIGEIVRTHLTGVDPLAVKGILLGLTSYLTHPGVSFDDLALRPTATDTTDPTITASISPAPNHEGWSSTAATVAFTCTDDVGVATCPDPVVVDEDGTHEVSGTATDTSGNTATATAIVSIDKTDPTVVGALSGPSNEHGWHNAPVTVSFSCSDALSGVRSCSSPEVIGEGADQTATGQAEDVAGNTAASSVEGIDVDVTAPTITGRATTTPNAHGWYSGDVTVAWTCADGLSGVAECPRPTVITGEGSALSVSGTATDRAGNSATVTVSGIDIDRTKPTVAYAGNAGTYTVDQQVTIDCVAADALSGIDWDTCQDVDAPAYALGLGVHELTADALDRAGNHGTGRSSFQVEVTFASLSVLTERFVTDPAIAGALTDQLAAAQRAALRGNDKTKENILGAYVNHLSAQTGKAVSAADAETLSALAEAL